MSVKDIWTGIKWEFTKVALYLLKSGWGQSLRPVCSTSLLSSAQLSHLDSGLATFTAYCWNAVWMARRKHFSYHKSSQSKGLEINKAKLGNSTTGSKNFKHTTISWLSLEKYQSQVIICKIVSPSINYGVSPVATIDSHPTRLRIHSGSKPS